MIKKISILLLIVIIGCKQQENHKKNSNNFNLTGTISGGYSDYIFLRYGKIKDSIKVTNGKFEFSGILETPTQQGSLILRPPSNIGWVYLENSNIKITSEYSQTENNRGKLNLIDITNINGSKTAKIQEKYSAFWKENKLKENFNKLLYQEVHELVKTNPKNSFSGKIIGDLASSSSKLTINELENLYSIIDTTCQNKSDLMYYRDGIKSLKKYNVGMDFLSFSLPNQESSLININDYKGKITLVDFWASWCGPCRVKHPDIVDLYNEFKNQNFDIISISSDRKLNSWKKAVKKDGLIWENLIDQESKVSDELGIQGIPFNYLLDVDGKIIGVNLSIEKIRDILIRKPAGNNTYK